MAPRPVRRRGEEAAGAAVQGWWRYVGWRAAVAIATVAVVVPLLAFGVRDLASLGTRETSWREQRASERAAARDASFDEFAVAIKIEAHRDVGLVHHPQAGGYLVQVQKPLNANTSLLQVPFDAVLDAVTACAVWPSFCQRVDSHLDDVALALSAATAKGGSSSSATPPAKLTGEALDRAVGRLKLTAALLRMKWEATATATTTTSSGTTAKAALTPQLRVLLPWVKTILLADDSLAADVQLRPEVASKCLDAADRRAWIAATSMIAAERNALLVVAKASPELGVDVSLADVAWAQTVIRRRSWMRPAPFYLGLVPLVDLNDQRTGDGERPALRADRPVTATIAFDEKAKKAHLVLTANVGRGAYPVVRGDDDGANPMVASATVRRYGFFDNRTTAVLSHAAALFSDLDRAVYPSCHDERQLYFNTTTGLPSFQLSRCVEVLTGKAKGVRKFLGLHASRAAKELYDPKSRFACESFVHKRDQSDVAVQQARVHVAAFHHTRASLLAVAKRLSEEEAV